MKKKEAKELHTMLAAELEAKARELRERLRSLRFDLAAGKVKNVAELRIVKKDIARVETALARTLRLK